MKFCQNAGIKVFCLSNNQKTEKREIEGKDYYFISYEDFEKKKADNEFVEWENVHGEFYGTLKSEIEKNINNSNNIILDVDVKGAISIKKLYPDAVSIFIDAPIDEIKVRLRNRKTESDEQINKRIERMEWELSMKDKFDYVVLNKTNPEGTAIAVKEITEIIKSKS